MGAFACTIGITVLAMLAACTDGQSDSDAAANAAGPGAANLCSVDLHEGLLHRRWHRQSSHRAEHLPNGRRRNLIDRGGFGVAFGVGVGVGVGVGRKT